MSKRRAYKSTSVKNIALEEVLKDAPEGPITIGMDVGKDSIFVVARYSSGEFRRPWTVKNPSEIRYFAGFLRKLSQFRPVTPAMESTGTYGDALRQALTDAGVIPDRVSGKAVHDYAEIFDGVPSQHDGKDAAMIAELAAIGKSTPWPFEPKQEQDAEIRYWVDWMDMHQRVQVMWIGRLEALLARHWPEATGILDFTSATLLKTLVHYGGPAALAADTEAADRLVEWSRRRLRPRKIMKFIASAKETAGVRQIPAEVRRLREFARQALNARREVQKAKRELKRLAGGNETIMRMARVAGTATACVVWASIGDPNDYSCGEAYRKAAGMNLKERSSGRYQGQLKLTKRGPAAVRRWMYFAAMRLVQEPAVRPWHEAKKKRDNGKATKSLIAVSRRLILAMYSVGVRGEPFEPWRLFPGRSIVRKKLQARFVSA